MYLCENSLVVHCGDTKVAVGSQLSRGGFTLMTAQEMRSARRMLLGTMDEAGSKAVVVTGEVGSGKTENVVQLMKDLGWHYQVVACTQLARQDLDIQLKEELEEQVRGLRSPQGCLIFDAADTCNDELCTEILRCVQDEMPHMSGLVVLSVATADCNCLRGDAHWVANSMQHVRVSRYDMKADAEGLKGDVSSRR